jgi:uncharacterized protein (DUF885 family)
VTSPQVSFEEYVKDIVSAKRFAPILAGNVERIREYTKRGHIQPQHIPEEVERAYDHLVSRGYTGYLLQA